LLYKALKIIAWIKNRYVADPRALALMRIGIALVVIADLLIRSDSIIAHYTGAGLWPSELATSLGWKKGYWSVHTLNDDPFYAHILFSIHGLLALFVLIGFKTRISTVLLWLFTISLHNRNIYVLQAGDDLLRLVLMWGIFLPWHARYSIDNLNKQILHARFAIPSIGYFILIASVYFFTVLLKTSSEWWSEGTAAYYALSIEQLRLPVTGDLLYRYPTILKILTWTVIIIELCIPILIMIPSKRGSTRLIAFIMIVILHSGIGLTLYVGLFYVIGIVSAIGLIPSSTFDKLKIPHFIIENSRIKINYFTPAIINGIGMILIVICLLINLSTIHGYPYKLHPVSALPTHVMRLDQRWGMFSPGIIKKDGWFVYEGIDSAGHYHDLRMDSDTVNFKKPPHIVSMYQDDRWRKLAENMQNDNFTFLRPLYCKFLLHNWNKDHPAKKMKVLNLYFMEKNSLPGYHTTPVKKINYCVCYES
jgi:hypothetical protein